MESTGIIVLVIGAALLFYIASIFNKLISLKNRGENAFAQIEVQLKRRHDLVPNLVESTKAYLTHERETLEAVTSARNTAITDLKTAARNPTSASAIGNLSRAESALNSALSRLNVVIEAYPELKADQTLIQLNEELNSTENRVAFARQAFNDCVTSYNIYKQSFPPVFLAGFFGHRANAKLLEFADSEALQVAPRIEF
ncbi:LemA family protein [Microbulbifer sp. OS29]|uniref:LemA family protein n=1 Tax=Microbulbifer okhotskensis TaxID=2926617 RepID=A0A9X2ELD0_9GAMM|nr:LemA family protein [Microbulbifer okhotskensis]MCO1333700.1 LemA family protein [Microbulbifer okhotskensis]